MFFSLSTFKGSVTNYKNRPLCEFVIAKFDVIFDYVIPFFEKHPILGSKRLNFLDFKTAAYIIKNKEHLNENGIGLDNILQLKKRITSLYKNTDNRIVELGTEESDQKR